jgi:dienelactone hydrolase
VLCALLGGCGSSPVPHPPRAHASPFLTFGYDATLPLRFVDRGRINRRTEPVAVDDVSFRSDGHLIKGYLLLPPGRARRPAVVFVHGTGGDRRELLERAGLLARRNVVTLTVTEPSTASLRAPAPGGPIAVLNQIRAAQIGDVVAVRRAVDVLRSLPQVDPKRIGYLGWSGGARTGTFVAASEPRVKALVLVSAGAAPTAAYVAKVPAGLRAAVRTILGSVDPIRYIAKARSGSVLLQDGTRDEIVPHSALVNIALAAPSGTTVRWYNAGHALNLTGYRDAFDWLARKLPID